MPLPDKVIRPILDALNKQGMNAREVEEFTKVLQLESVAKVAEKGTAQMLAEELMKHSGFNDSTFIRSLGPQASIVIAGNILAFSMACSLPSLNEGQSRKRR